MAKRTRTLYHGTSDIFLNQIKEKGLLPRQIHGNSVYARIEYESRPEYVYLSDRFASFYAAFAVDAYGGKEMIIRVEVPDIALYPDEEFVGTVIAQKEKLSHEEERELILQIDPADYKDKWELSLKYMGTVAAKSVSTDAITGIHVFDPETELNIMLATGWDSNPQIHARMGLQVGTFEGIGGQMNYPETLKMLFDQGPAAVQAELEKRHAAMAKQGKRKR